MPTIRLQGGKVILKGGKVACSCCCPTTLPGWQYDSVGKSLAKNGWLDNDHASQTKVLLYKAITAGGTITRTYAAPEGSEAEDSITTYAHFGTSTYDPITGVTTHGMQVTQCHNGPFAGCTTYAIDLPIGNPPWVGFYPWGFIDACQPTRVNTQFTATVQGPGNAYCVSLTDLTISGSATKTVSDEYTTDELVGNVQAQIEEEGFDADFNDTGGSYRNLTANEVNYSERRSKARLPLTALDVTLQDGKTYNAIYVIRFTPLSGSPEDGAEQTLAIAFTTGMTHSAPIDIPVPEANGTNSAVLLRWECPTEEPEA